MFRTKTFARLLPITAVLFFCAPDLAWADTIVLNTGFESDVVGPKSPGAIVGDGNFTVSGTGAFTVLPGSRTVPCHPQAGILSQCFSITSFRNEPSLITSLNTFGPGNYTLVFDLAFSSIFPANRAVVSLGNYAEEFAVLSPFQSFSRNITLTTGANLVFSITGNLLPTIYLDNIRLTRIEQASPVPEPATLILLVTGLAGVAAKVRKRRKGAPDEAV
jgi:hypothetical protein